MNLWRIRLRIQGLKMSCSPAYQALALVSGELWGKCMVLHLVGKMSMLVSDGHFSVGRVSSKHNTLYAGEINHLDFFL